MATCPKCGQDFANHNDDDGSCVDDGPPITPKEPHPCPQCGKDMGWEYLLGSVCGKCCRKNHRRVAGR